MILYEFLTWLIIQLGKFRHWYAKKFLDSYLRIDRDEMNKMVKAQEYLKTIGFTFECCDCGLAHDFKNWGDKDLHCIPHRPKNYKYKWR